MRETRNLEYKREVSKTFLKTVSAFANYGDGSIVFGVDDDGSIRGIDDPEETALRIENTVNDALRPVPRFELTIDNEKGTVTLRVHEGKAKPYLYGGKAYRRADSSTVEVSRLEYNRLSLAGINVSYDALESANQELVFDRLETELVERIGLEKLDRNALVSLELMSREGAYNNAAALLSDRNDFPGTDVARFGESISIILSRHTVENTSILEQMSRVLEIFDENYVYEEVVGSRRERKARVPREAFREAMANALVHRCWDVSALTRVSMFPDRIEIVSPGGLPDGITQEEYLNGGLSVARNPIVANVFFRLGYIERFGTGILRILEEYDDLNASPQFIVRGASVAVVLPAEDSLKLTEDERRVLDAIPQGGVVSRADIEKVTGIAKGKAVRLLNKLIALGQIGKKGAGRATLYSRK